MAEPVIEEYRFQFGSGTWSKWMPRSSERGERYSALHGHDYQFRLVHGGNVIAGPVDVDPAKVRPGDPVDYYGGDDEDISVGSLRGVAVEVEEIMRPAKSERQVGGTHYQTGDHEPFLVIDEWSTAWPKPAVFYLACAVKYIARLGRKGDKESWKQDLDKAVHYLTEAKKRI